MIKATSTDLIDAARNGAAIATRAALARGSDEKSTRNKVIAWFRREVESESFGPFADERLMSAVSLGIEETMAEWRDRADRSGWWAS